MYERHGVGWELCIDSWAHISCGEKFPSDHSAGDPSDRIASEPSKSLDLIMRPSKKILLVFCWFPHLPAS